MSNPTVFKIGSGDASDIIWLVDNQEPLDVVLPYGKQFVQASPQETLDLIKRTLARHGTIFASFYRPGAFWEYEVFVCPKCKHATQIEFAEGVAPDEQTLLLSDWWCKYCYTAWACSKDDGMYRVKVDEND